MMCGKSRTQRDTFSVGAHQPIFEIQLDLFDNITVMNDDLEAGKALVTSALTFLSDTLVSRNMYSLTVNT